MPEKGMSIQRIGAGSAGLPFNLRYGMIPSGIRLYDMMVPMVIHTRMFFADAGSREKCR